MFVFLPLLACAPEVEVEPASLVFLAPSEGESLPTGEIDVSVIVENFSLVAPKHGSDEEGTDQGYVAISLDGGGVENFGSTTFGLVVDTDGEHTLNAELLYEDGDSLDDPATATVTFSTAPA